MRERAWGRWREGGWLACILLLTLAAYGQVVRFPFTGYDDAYYVGPDTAMSHGLSWANLRYAFTHLHFHLYYPLTLLSHMADAQLYGQWAGGHHLTNLILHLICIALVYLVFRLATHEPGRSAAVAALFALHPLHVEAVVWIAERKELLCTLFTLLALLAYGAYVRRSGWRRHLSVSLLFLCALLAKPMAVTLPAVFLLVDIWPLRRWKVGEDAREEGSERFTAWSSMWKRTWPLLREKLPWFAMSLAFSALTVVANREGGLLTSLTALPIPWRIGNAVYAYGQYLAKALLPTGLSVFYPHPGRTLPLGMTAASALLLFLLLWLGFRWRRKAPYLLVGVLFFLGTLLPVIGFLQVGSLQAYADRYTYFTLLGPFAALVWGISDWAEQRHLKPSWLKGAFAAVVLFLTVLTWYQVRSWRSDESLFGRSLALYPNGNYVAWAVLGNAYMEKGQLTPAQKALENAVAIAPNLSYPWLELGDVLVKEGDDSRAEACYRKAIELSMGKEGSSLYGLGRLLAMEHRSAEAIPYLQKAWKCQPYLVEAPITLASALRDGGQPLQALAVLRKAVALFPRDWRVQANLGLTLEVLGRPHQALASFDQALRVGGPAVRREVAALMLVPARVPKPIAARALTVVESVIRAEPGSWPAFCTLAAAWCALGQREEAMRAQAQAERLAMVQGGESARQASARLAPACLKARETASPDALPSANP
jgi:tetratricopeptide (TPR) repeat protein